MELKYLLFWFVVILGVPLAAWACRRWAWASRLAVVGMIWSTCQPDRVAINFASREFYRAMSRGIEVSLADVFAWALLLSMFLGRRERPLRWFVPLTLPWLGFFAVGVCSWLAAAASVPVPEQAAYIPYPVFETRLYPLFELFKMARAFVVYFVVVNHVRDEESLRSVVWGLVFTTVFMTGTVLYDRYALGVNRVRASLGHPNTLATYMAMMATLAFGFSMQARSWGRGMLLLLPTAMAGVCVIMAISRGGLLALALGLALACAFLLPRYFSARNLGLLAFGAMCAVAMLAKASTTLLSRFAHEQDARADLEYRGLYNAQARLMARDHLFGVGLGNFSAWSFEKYAARVDEDLPPGTPPHNLWYLTLGETGWPGVLAFLLLWLRFYGLAIPVAFRAATSPLVAAGITATCATLAGHAQNMLQLGFRQSPLFFLNHICLGLAVAAWYQHRASRAVAPETPGVA